MGPRDRPGTRTASGDRAREATGTTLAHRALAHQHPPRARRPQAKPTLDLTGVREGKKELWLIQLPQDMDVSQLAGTEISLGDVGTRAGAVAATVSTSGGGTLEMVQEHVHVAKQCFVIGSSGGKNRVHAVTKRVTMRGRPAPAGAVVKPEDAPLELGAARVSTPKKTGKDKKDRKDKTPKSEKKESRKEAKSDKKERKRSRDDRDGGGKKAKRSKK